MIEELEEKIQSEEILMDAAWKAVEICLQNRDVNHLGYLSDKISTGQNRLSLLYEIKAAAEV